MPRLSPRLSVTLGIAAAFAAGLAVPRPGGAQTSVNATGLVGWDALKGTEAPWGEIRRYFTGETAATKDLLIAAVVVKPGMAVHKAHRHAEEEYLYIVEGTGTWKVDGKESPLKKGDVLYAEPWAFHGLTNTGTEPLTFFVVKYNGKGVQPPAHPGDGKPDEEK